MTESTVDKICMPLSVVAFSLGLGCAPRTPADLVPLASVVADQPADRLAVDWSMPIADARAYLSTSPEGCPAADSRLLASACLHAPAGRGRSAAQPLQWGAAATTETLWFGRLRCNSGATPRIAQETLGTWLVQCPEDADPVRWFVDGASCGSPCPPPGVAVMPADAALLERQAALALEESRTGDALHFAGLSVTRFPNFASSWRMVGVARAATDDYAGALEAFSAALALDPADERARYYAVRAAHSAAQWPEARDRAAALWPELSGEPALQAEVQCIEVLARTELGDDSGAPLAATACAGGALGCCPLQPGRSAP